MLRVVMPIQLLLRHADPASLNNTSTSTPVPVPQANVSIVKTVNNATPNVGNVIFTLTASNAGPRCSHRNQCNGCATSSYTFVSNTQVQAHIHSGTGVWSMGTLSNGASATLTITATVNAAVVMPIRLLQPMEASH
jgi:hypothetical protein